MFGKSSKPVEFWFHPGIYQFELPFLTGGLVPLKDGLVPVEKCDVEFHVGNEYNENHIATILISTKKESTSPTNFIEKVATTLLKEYLVEIIKDVDMATLASSIRWIQREHYPNERYQEVIFSWDEKKQILSNPEWNNVKDDWIIEAHKLPLY